VLKRALALTALVSLAGCGGGGRSASSLPHVAAAAPASSGRATTSFVVTIPRATPASANSRAPRYVSPATQSLGITIDPGTGNQSFTAMNIGPGDPNCNNPTPVSPLTCTVSVAVAPGSHTFDFRTYDQRLDGNGNPQGSVLSANIGFPFTVVPGQNNALKFVLQGIPASISVLAQPNQDVRGDQTGGFDLYGAYKADGTTLFPRKVTVVATDADGNFIVGPGAPTITLTSSDTSALSNGVASASNPNLFTITPAGWAYNNGFQLTATATPSTDPSANSGASPISVKVPVRYVARNAPRVYVSGGPGQNWVKVFDENGNAVSTAGTWPNLSGPMGLAYDDFQQRIIVANYSDGTVRAYDLDGNAAGPSNAISGLVNPMAVAMDNSMQRIYVSTHDLGVFVYDTSGGPVATSGNWKQPANPVHGTPNAYPYDAQALLITGRGLGNVGSVYVNDVTSNSIVVYDMNGNWRMGFYADNGVGGLTQDPVSGRIYGTWTAHSVTVFDEIGNIVAVPGAWLNTHQPLADAYDPASGYIYVNNSQGAAHAGANVTVYDQSGNQIATSGTFAGADNGWGMTIVP
jgi:hypothetical protein